MSDQPIPPINYAIVPAGGMFSQSDAIKGDDGNQLTFDDRNDAEAALSGLTNPEQYQIIEYR